MKTAGLNKAKDVILKLAKKIFNRPMYLFFFLFLVDLAIAFILCWQLVLFPAIDNKPQSLLILNKNALDKFVADWEKQEEESSAIKSNNYQDIFFGFSDAKNQTSPTSSLSTTTQSQ